jgi:hypothetical protein
MKTQTAPLYWPNCIRLLRARPTDAARHVFARVGAAASGPARSEEAAPLPGSASGAERGASSAGLSAALRKDERGAAREHRRCCGVPSHHARQRVCAL